MISTDDVLIALPPVHSIRIPEFCGHRRYQQGGVVAAHKVGDSEEFMQVREYRPGDPLKRIHWPSSARVGNLAVKEFNDEYFARIALILDTFSPAAFSSELEDAVSIAASYLVAGTTEEEVIDLLFVGAEAVSFSAGRGTGSTERMLEILAGVEPCRDKPFSVLSGLVGERISSFCGAVVVLLALDDERLALLRMLTVAGIEYRVFWVTADAEAAQEQVSATGLSAIRIVPLGHVAEALRTS